MKVTRRPVVVLLVAVLAALASAASVASSEPGADGTGADDTGARIDAYLGEYADANHVPGLAVRVVKHGHTVHEHLAGEDGNGSRVTDHTPFLIGSVAKTMTSTLVMQLEARGALALDDHVSDHLDHLDVADPTVEQLLTHTAGFSSADGIAVADRFDNEPGAIRRAVGDLDHTGTVGDYEYTSADYLVLGALVEQVTGHPFDVVLRDRLLDPLGMDDSGATEELAHDLPPGHRQWWGRAVGYHPEFDESGAPYASVTSTLADLDRYARAQLGTLNGIPEKVRDRAQAPHVEASNDRYGYGWSVTDIDGERVVHHTGATPGYFTHVLLVPDRGVAVVLLANTYAESRAPSLAAGAQDVWRILEGERREPAGGDGLLAVLPWLLAGLALAALPSAVIARRRPRPVWGRVLTAAGCLALVGGLWLLPSFFGETHRALRIWMPDAAWAVTVGMVLWVVAGLAFAVPLRRGVQQRRAVRDDP